MLGLLPLALSGLFALGVWVYMVWRMRRAMAPGAFWSAVAIELGGLSAGVAGMLIKGYSITLMLVILGLAETAIVLSTWGRVEIFFNVIAAPESWTSRHATVVALRLCAVAVVLSLAAIPLLIRLDLNHRLRYALGEYSEPPDPNCLPRCTGSRPSESRRRTD